MAKRYDCLIIGGGIAGTTAAETIRKHEPHFSIAILGDEAHPLYSRVFLPAYSRDEIGLEHVFLRRLEDYAKNNIDLYLSQKVKDINFRERHVRTENDDVFSYQKLLIASGGRVESWEFEREFQDKILRLQTLEDAERLRTLLRGKRIPRVLVVGGGFITLEFLNIFYKYGVQTTLLLRDEFFWKGQVDEAGGELFRELFESHGITLVMGDEIHVIRRGEEGLEVLTREKRKISCDFIAAGLGLRRSTELAQGVLETEVGIRVNEFLEVRALNSSSPMDGGLQVWAAGDVAEYFDEFAGRWKVVGNWTHGFFTGHLAGLNMIGQKKRFQLVSAYSIKALGSVVTFLGEVDERHAGAVICRYESSSATASADAEALADKSEDKPQEKKYIRFFLKEERLIGAVLINAYKEKPLLARWIETRKDLSLVKEALGQTGSGLEAL